MSLFRNLLFVALLSCLGLVLYATVIPGRGAAQDKNGPEVQDPPKNLTITPKTKSLKELALAAQLINFGRAHKNAEALLLAAKIIHATPTEKLKAEKNEVSGGSGKAPAAKQPDNSPKMLIAQAKSMSTAPHLKALAEATERIVEEEIRGHVGGPARAVQNVGPGQVWLVAGNFVGGQMAQVDIDLAGVKGIFLLTVHDASGRILAKDAVPGNYFNCRWYQATTGPVVIRFENFDTLTFRCDLLTN